MLGFYIEGCTVTTYVDAVPSIVVPETPEIDDCGTGGLGSL